MDETPEPRSKRKWITIGLISLLVVSIIFAGVAFYLTRGSVDLTRVSTLTAPTAPRAIKLFCPLDGTEVADRATTLRRPVIVQVDNAPAARQQSGLSQADIVYEAMAEGDVTRFAAIFACRDAAEVGPVRSARLINLELVPEYDGLLANSGSSEGVTAELEARPDIPNIVHSNFPDAYWRVSDRFAPHNLMTSTADIRAAAVAAGHSGEARLKSLAFKDDTPAPAIANIAVPYSGIVNVSYQYDAATNSWPRFIGGTPHVDAATGAQLSPRNVIIQYVEVSESGIIEDTGGNYGLQFGLAGSGRIVMFRDGMAIEGTWLRDGDTEITTYLDAAGEPLPLNRGLTFIQLVPVDFPATWG
ncbi:MAG: DUF3048 domain-containing protein [Thermoleophilia bacterium]